MQVYYNKLDQLIIRIIFFLFKINPKIPIKNKNNDRFIVYVFVLILWEQRIFVEVLVAPNCAPYTPLTLSFRPPMAALRPESKKAPLPQEKGP